MKTARVDEEDCFFVIDLKIVFKWRIILQSKYAADGRMHIYLDDSLVSNICIFYGNRTGELLTVSLPLHKTNCCPSLFSILRFRTILSVSGTSIFNT